VPRAVVSARRAVVSPRRARNSVNTVSIVAMLQFSERFAGRC
jgi:hypothetical protein